MFRFGIRDLRRHGEKIIVSPGLHIAAICDSFGRIIIYDIHRGIAIRMFKGYREAEIGFIQIEESSSRDASMSSSSRKSALFIVIHAPKRQLVEVCSIENFDEKKSISFEIFRSGVVNKVHVLLHLMY